MKTFINEYKELIFSRVIKTTNEIINTKYIRVYRRIITMRRFANRILRIPQRKEIIKIPERIELIKEEFKNRFKPVILNANIVVEHRKFKNKTILQVKTDVGARYLRAI